MLIVTYTESTIVRQDEQICAVIKAVIDSTVHRVQDIWDIKSTTEYWGLLLVDTKTRSKRSIKSECSGQFDIYGHLELALFLIAIITGDHSFFGTGMGR